MKFKGKSEEEALFGILKGFFAKKTVQGTLRLIEAHKLSGCEKWLQIELLKYLFKTKQVLDDEIVKEEVYAQDQRKDDYRQLQRIDITFRLKNEMGSSLPLTLEGIVLFFPYLIYNFSATFCSLETLW